MEIQTNVIKSDNGRVSMSNSLKVEFQNPEDESNFQEMISELNIGDSPQDQLYLLTAMAYAGVSYSVS